MSKTIQFQFKVGSTLTNVTSCVLRDPTNTYGVKRNDTGATVVASGTALTHLSTGLYSYTFTEPASGLNYDYWIEYVYAGNTKRIKQTLETVAGAGSVPLAPSVYKTMGVDTVSLGDSVLAAFLTNQADLVWAMQARRGVALDLQYQYYTADLLVLAMDHVRMLIDTETDSSLMADRAQMDAASNSSANASSSKTRTSSFTESSSSSQNWTRTASRSASASSRLSTSNSASRSASQSDYSTLTQTATGSSYRTQSGSSLAQGTLANPDSGVYDGTSAKARSDTLSSTISRTKYEGGYLDGSGMPPGLVAQYKSFSAALQVGGGGGVGGGINWSTGDSAVYHQVTPSLLGRISPSGALTPNGASGNLSVNNYSTVEHGRSLVGSQTGSGSTAFVSNGTRTNNRTGSMSASSSSSLAGNSSSTQTSTSHEAQTRNASSASHSESTYHSTMTATSSAHRDSTGSDAMTASGAVDREYYSQIFDSLKTMWVETQDAIHRLEQQMLMTSRYLTEKIATVTPQAKLVGAAALPTASTIIQRPGIFGNRRLTRPFDRFVVK